MEICNLRFGRKNGVGRIAGGGGGGAEPMSGLGRYGVRAEKLAKEPSLSRTGRQISGEKAGKRARQAEKKSNWRMARGAKSRN